MSATNTPKPLPPQISPYSILRSLSKHWGLIVAPTILGAGVTFLVVRVIPPVYSAEAVVLVESQRIPENYVAATVSANLEARVNALRQQILSYSRLVDVIKKHNLYTAERAHRPLEEVVELMRDDLSITVQRGSAPGRPAAFTVNYRGGDPAIVAQIANLIASFFIDENLRTREVEAVGTSEFLDAQLTEAKKRLEEQEQQLSAYKLRYSGELPQQENALISSIAQARTELTGLQDGLNRIQQNKLMAQSLLDTAEAELAMLQRIAVATAPVQSSGPLSPPYQLDTSPTPQRESERLQQQYDSLRARYGESHPDVKRAASALSRTIAQEARESIQQPASRSTSNIPIPARSSAFNPQSAESTRALGERIATLRAQIAGWDRELTGVERDRQKLLIDIADMQTRIGRLPLREQELAGVMRDYENTRTNYRSLLDKKMSADVAANMERRQKAERFVMLEMARKPERPIKPKKPLLLAAGSVFCLALGIAAAVGIEAKNGMLLGEWELPPGILVLGRVPSIVTPAAGSPRFPWKPLFWAAVPICIMGCLMAGIYTGWLNAAWFKPGWLQF
ncbi:MAG TPA: Wzz/FepE/Etk N-terminal domain-containing protein [Bryobacteraceae bacterium]|nr:Wzz/FepE/Etk N-terminal domain-containing protein [Bryobacteraceae bacterium]